MQDTLEHPSIVFVNGKQQVSPDITDRGFAYGDGLFETMLCRNCRIPLLEYHLDRLAEGCQRLSIVFNRDEVEGQLGSAMKNLRGDEGAVVRLHLTRKTGIRGSYPESNSEPNVYIVGSPLHQNISTAASINLVPANSPLYCAPSLVGLKHSNRLAYIVASLGIALGDDQEIFFFDSSANIVETMHHNIFFVRDNKVFTPALTHCGVAGVMRRFIREVLVDEVDMALVEQIIPIGEIENFTEVFIANAVRGIVGVCGVGNTRFSDHLAAEKLNRAFLRFVTQQCA